MVWYDCVVCDRRIERKAVSSSRYLLDEVTERCGARDATSQHVECRHCGAQLETGTRCPECGSDEVAEYDLG